MQGLVIALDRMSRRYSVFVYGATLRSSNRSTKQLLSEIYKGIVWPMVVYYEFSLVTSSKSADKRKAKPKKVLEPDTRKNLTNIRVVQRNLVYVTNLSLDIAKEEVREVQIARIGSHWRSHRHK